jgi:hypothetical protein
VTVLKAAFTFISSLGILPVFVKRVFFCKDGKGVKNLYPLLPSGLGATENVAEFTASMLPIILNFAVTSQ